MNIAERIEAGSARTWQPRSVPRLSGLRRVHPGFIAGGVLLAGVLLCALVPDWVQTHDPVAPSFAAANQGPSAEHWMGTDRLGRDVFSRVVAGARVSLLMGLVPVAIGVLVGGTIGLVAGTYRRLGDLVLMRLVDMMMAFPALVLALLLIAVIGTRGDMGRTAGAMIAVGVAFIPAFARVMYGSVLTISRETYIEAARSIGCSDRRLMFRHMLPNAMASMIVLASLNIATAVLAGAALSFIGLGAQPPTIEWGGMIADGRQVLQTSWWVSTFPGLAMMATVLGVHLIGDALRDVLDPRMGAG